MTIRKGGGEDVPALGIRGTRTGSFLSLPKAPDRTLISGVVEQLGPHRII